VCELVSVSEWLLYEFFSRLVVRYPHSGIHLLTLNISNIPWDTWLIHVSTEQLNGWLTYRHSQFYYLSLQMTYLIIIIIIDFIFTLYIFSCNVASNEWVCKKWVFNVYDSDKLSYHFVLSLYVELSSAASVSSVFNACCTAFRAVFAMALWPLHKMADFSWNQKPCGRAGRSAQTLNCWCVLSVYSPVKLSLML